MRTCGVCGENFQQSTGRPAKRCPSCRPDGDRYGTAHKNLRARTAPSAYGTPCVRCGQPLTGRIHLDHGEHGGYLGFSHETCNTRAGAAKRNGKGETCRWHGPLCSSAEVHNGWSRNWGPIRLSDGRWIGE